MTLFSYSSLISASALAVVVTATGCQSLPNTGSTHGQNNPPSAPTNSNSSDNSNSMERSLTEHALSIQAALANKDYASVINDIHPTRGVRFSMYAYVRPESDKVFSRAQFAQYLQQSKIRFTWGDLDGTGELLVTPLPNYLETWVQADTFNNTPISINKVKPTGNMINNVKDIYPQADVVDFYRKGSEKYSGMDWRVLRLVFDEYQGKRYLVAIISDQWTV